MRNKKIKQDNNILNKDQLRFLTVLLRFLTLAKLRFLTLALRFLTVVRIYF